MNGGKEGLRAASCFATLVEFDEERDGFFYAFAWCESSGGIVASLNRLLADMSFPDRLLQDEKSDLYQTLRISQQRIDSRGFDDKIPLPLNGKVTARMTKVVGVDC